jgi:hypothetical protein
MSMVHTTYLQSDTSEHLHMIRRITHSTIGLWTHKQFWTMTFHIICTCGKVAKFWRNSKIIVKVIVYSMKIIRSNLQEKSFQSVCIKITTSAATFQCGSEVKTQFWHHISQYRFLRRGLLEQLGPTWTRSFLPYQKSQGLNSNINTKVNFSWESIGPVSHPMVQTCGIRSPWARCRNNFIMQSNPNSPNAFA